MNITKKSKFMASVAVLGFCLSMSNISLAEIIQSDNLNIKETTVNTAEIQSAAQNIIIAANLPLNQITPAGKETASEEKNIVPVLDLKGGVESQEVKAETPLKIWLNQDTMTGDWKGLRTKLEDNGITLSQSYMVNNFMKEHGGGLLGNSRPSYQGISNTSLELNTEKLRLYPGGKLFVSFQNIHGQGLSDKYVGDYMYFNGYETSRPGPQLSEYWYEQSLLKDKLKVKIGKQDGNCEFQALDTGFQFANSGFSFIVNSSLPTYPNQAIGVVTTLAPTENIYFKHGFFDGSGVGSQSGFNTIFHKEGSNMNIEELGFTHSKNSRPGKYIFGMWQRSANIQELLNDEQALARDNGTFEPITYKGNHGLYAEFEQMFYKEKADDTEDSQGLTILGQYAWAPKTRTELTKYFGTALVYQGLLPKRDNDAFGVGINFAAFSNKLGAYDSGRVGRKGESVLEVFYKIALTPWLYIQPDFQYINKPYYADKSTIVFGVRTNVTF